MRSCRTGAEDPLSSNGAEAGGFVRTRAGLPAPDIQFHAVPAIAYNDYQDAGPAMEHGMSVSACVLKPLSRGKVALRNASPFSKPAIVHNYYADPEDHRSMIEGIRACLKIAAQPAMRAHITQPYRGAEVRGSKADIWDYLQRHTQTIFHPTSTCAIGPVVDNELRVQGFDGLPVVDASVMPSIVRGSTNAPTIAVAERAADLIRSASGENEAQAFPSAALPRERRFQRIQRIGLSDRLVAPPAQLVVKRTATPPIWRGLGAMPSGPSSKTWVGVTLRTGPKVSIVVRRTIASISRISASDSPE